MKQLKCNGSEPSVKTYPKQQEFDFSPSLWDGIKLSKEIKDLKETEKVLKYQLSNARRYEPREAPEIEKNLREIEKKLNIAQKNYNELINKYSTMKEAFDEEEAKRDLEKIKTRQMFRKTALKKWHPDKFQKDPDYKRFEEFSKTLNILFDKLEKSYKKPEPHNQTTNETPKKKEEKKPDNPNIPQYINFIKNNSFFNTLFDDLVEMRGVDYNILAIISQAIHKMHIIRNGLNSLILKSSISYIILPNSKNILNSLKEITEDLSIPSMQRNKINNYKTIIENYIKEVENIFNALK